ncbi:MAG TPA: acyl-CoA desaturase [bacterium]|nr:acyl-CoA desaturase [bacterium]
MQPTEVHPNIEGIPNLTPVQTAPITDYHRNFLRTFTKEEKIDWGGSIPFFGVHVVGLLAWLTGISWAAVAMCFFMYYFRMFAITGIYHRYFSHRSYKTSRWFQFVMALWGTSCGQQGPLWWAAHHRHHHKYSDTPEDIHSPGLRGFWWSHWGWILCKRYAPTNEEAVKDLVKYPELKFINKHHGIAPFVLATLIFFFGAFLEHAAPGLHTNGMQMLAWGFFTSTTLLYHGTFTINSLSHVFGKKRFETGDDSKNNFWLSLITMGEGWHNNHHKFPYAESQGIYWWEIDMSHYILKMFSWVGLVWDIQKHPKELFQKTAKA